MTTTEIKELFELTTRRVAKIETESAWEIAQIRKEAEDIRKKNEEETAQIRKEAEDIRKKNEEETAQIRKEAEGIRKETEDIRKETEDIRKEARKLAEKDFIEIRESLKDTERHINKTSKHLGFYTDSVADISEEYFYRGLKSNISIGDMIFDTIIKNEHIDGKEYDIILENDKAIMLVSVKTNINAKHIKRLVNNDIVKLKNSSKYKSIDKKFYATIAGFTGASRVLNLAKEKGILILTLSEENQPTLVNSEVSPTVY